jgi:hypothetical protein
MAPVPPHNLPIFSLQIDDLSHPGAFIFTKYVNALDALQIAVSATYTWLYSFNPIPIKYSHLHCPPLPNSVSSVQKIHLRLSLMDGVARTSGTPTEKWIEFSLHYIQKVADRVQEEIVGVLVHEVVHCYQFNGNGTCPGGLIEGIAGSSSLSSSLPNQEEETDDAPSHTRLRASSRRVCPATLEELSGRQVGLWI